MSDEIDLDRLCVVALAAMNERENDGFGDNPDYLLPAVRAVVDALGKPGDMVFGDLTIGKLLPADTVLPSPCAHQWLLVPRAIANDDMLPCRAWCPECGETREAP